jgi:vitamin B12 transporter
MKTRILSARFAALPLALASAWPAYAQTQSAPQLKEVVVSATRSSTRTDDLVSDVIVIDRADIERSAGRTLPELLGRVPGISFSSNGGLGKTSSVNIRGAEARHTVLLIDGARYGSATTGTPVWDNIPLNMIERIEIVKGPASALYGSEAVGGVVQIFLRQAAEGFQPQASITVGGENYRQAHVGVSGGTRDATYTLGVQKTREVGFSSTNTKVGVATFNPDRDGYDQNALNASVNYRINSAWKLNAGLLYSDSVSQLDDGLNRDSKSAYQTIASRMGLEGKVMPNWKTQLRISQSVDSSRAIVATPANLPGLFKTTQNQITWQNDVDTPIGVVLAGLESLNQKVDSSTNFAVNQRDVTSYFLGLNGAAGRHAWQLNARNDNNSQFGQANTTFAGYGFSITPAWRVNASYGTSFVAPSFNQLYFPTSATFKGNPLLQPERGRNTDIGLTWSESGHTVKWVRYLNKITDIIVTVGISPVNVSSARLQGTSLSYVGNFGALSLNASADSVDPRNQQINRVLPRRSKTQVRAGADYAIGSWTLGGSLLRSGDSFNDANNTQRLDGYTTADLYADYQMDKNWKLRTKINNISNRVFETILGYNQPGRAVYVSLIWQPK